MLEQLVRPFQTPATISDQVPITTVETGVPPVARLVWSANGSTPITASQSFRVEMKHKEVERKTSTIRVANPDDETQFVDVKRVEQITFSGTFTQVNGNGTTNSGAGGPSGGQVTTSSGGSSAEVVPGGGAPTNTAYAPAPAGTSIATDDDGNRNTLIFSNDSSS